MRVTDDAIYVTYRDFLGAVCLVAFIVWALCAN